MKHTVFAIIVALFALTCVTPAQARVGVSIGLGCCGYGGYYGGYYPPYYAYPAYYGYPTYYAPPPPSVVYASPQPSVTYVVPPSTAVQQAPAAATPASSSTPPSPTFKDGKGRTCRQFQSIIDGAPVNGTACLQPDGSWSTVGE